MREIKFRAWQKHHRKMLPVKIIDFNRNTITVDYGEKTIPRFNTFDMENFELMQYTGLKDKYGTEIYEGDICWEWIEYCKQTKPYVVEDLRKLYLETERDDSYYRITSLQVIGNIYENPELLGGAE
jgi:hypothetical protein